MIDLAEQWSESILAYDNVTQNPISHWNRTQQEIEERTQYAKNLLVTSLLRDTAQALASAQNGERVAVPSYIDFLEALTFLNIAQTQTIINHFLQMPIRDNLFIDVGVEEREDESVAANNVEDTQGIEFIEENAINAIFEDGLVICDEDEELWSKLSADQCIAIIAALHPYNPNNNNALPQHQTAAISQILATCNPRPSAEQIQLMNQNYGLNMQPAAQPDLKN